MNRFLLLTSFLTASALVSAAIADPVKTDAGLVSGVPGKDPTVKVYKGIPFSAPPVGQNRWKPPQPVAKWDGVKVADTFSPTCNNGNGGGRGAKGKAKGGGGDAKAPVPQTQAPQAKAKAQAKGPAGPGPSEDCLYLNVWTAAASANERRPVIVWTYGGAFTGGSGSEPRYDGETLAKKGAVVVTYNYRLGMFGFFAHPELAKESGKNTSGNYGLADFATTLRWVQKNIAAFGGDPNRVTIAGESAGAMAVAALVGSPEGKGLFHRAIAQSGGYMGTQIAKMRTREAAETAGARAAGSDTIAQLRAMSTEEVIQAVTGVQAGIIVDGFWVTEEPSNVFLAGKQNKVDVMVGSNQDEGTFFGGAPANAEAFKTQAQARYGDLTPDFLKLYPSATNEEAAASALMRSRDEFGWHMRTWAQTQLKTGKKAYLYYFTRVTPGQEARGATHTAELTYMFGNPPANGAWIDVDKNLSDQMATYWVNFATNGDPNGKGLPDWQAYDPKKNDAKAMVFGNTTVFGDHISADRLKFYDQFYAKQK